MNTTNTRLSELRTVKVDFLAPLLYVGVLVAVDSVVHFYSLRHGLGTMTSIELVFLCVVCTLGGALVWSREQVELGQEATGHRRERMPSGHGQTAVPVEERSAPPFFLQAWCDPVDPETSPYR